MSCPGLAWPVLSCCKIPEAEPGEAAEAAEAEAEPAEAAEAAQGENPSALASAVLGSSAASAELGCSRPVPPPMRSSARVLRASCCAHFLCGLVLRIVSGTGTRMYVPANLLSTRSRHSAFVRRFLQVLRETLKLSSETAVSQLSHERYHV